MKPQFESRRHPKSRETHREAGAVRHTTSALGILRRVFLPPLLPQELPKYDPRGAKLRPLVLENMAPPVLFRMPASPLFHPQSTKCLRLCHRKRSAPSREKSLLQPPKMQNSDALTVQSNLMHIVSLQRDYPQSARETRQNGVRWLIHVYHSTPSLVRSLQPWSRGKRRSLRNATRTWPHSTEK